MSRKNADGLREIIFAASIPAGDRRIVAMLQKDGTRKVLRIAHGKETATQFFVPFHVSAFDLPYWFASVLRELEPAIDPDVLSACQADIRLQVPSTGSLLSVCVGPREQFHRCHLLHFDPAKLSSGCHGPSMGFSGPIEGYRFIRGSLRVIWTVLLKTHSDEGAKALQSEIVRPQEALASLDGPITGIVACNGRNWKSAGVPAEEVVNFARGQRISLRQVEDSGPGLAFRVARP